MFNLSKELLKLLPPTTLGLLAYVNEIIFLCRESARRGAGGWIYLTQAKLAKRVGRSRRSVALYERVLRDLGIIEVLHHAPSNRRSVRLRPLDDALPWGPAEPLRPLREWCNALHHSSATRCTTLGPALKGSRARPDTTPTGLTTMPAPRAGRASLAPEVVPERPLRSHEVLPRPSEVQRFAAELGIHRRYIAPFAATVRDLARLRGEGAARELLTKAREKFARIINPDERGRRAHVWLRGALRRLEEQSGPRSVAGRPRRN